MLLFTGITDKTAKLIDNIFYNGNVSNIVLVS